MHPRVKIVSSLDAEAGATCRTHARGRRPWPDDAGAPATRAPLRSVPAHRPARDARRRAPRPSRCCAASCSSRAGIAVASYLVKPAKARSFDLFYGSMYINDNTSPVAVDLASGKPTVRLTNAFTAVGAKTGDDIDVYPARRRQHAVARPEHGRVQHGRQHRLRREVDRRRRAAAEGTGDARRRRRSRQVRRPTSCAATQPSTSVYLVGAATVSAAVGSPSGTKARAYATVQQRAVERPGARRRGQQQPVAAHRHRHWSDPDDHRTDGARAAATRA